MKESRIIIIILTIMIAILIPLLYVFQLFGIDDNLSINIITNLECGAIVGLVTAISQYYVAKRKIVNSVYSLYLELYNTYYTCKNKEFLKHYDAAGVFRKMAEVSPKINELLSDYHGFFKKKDSTYIKLEHPIEPGENYKARNVIKALYRWFNEKEFNNTIDLILKDVEKALTNIDAERFQKDKQQIIKMYNFMWNN